MIRHVQDRNSRVMDIKRDLKEKREIFKFIISQHGDGPVAKPPGAGSGSKEDSVSVSGGDFRGVLHPSHGQEAR